MWFMRKPFDQMLTYGFRMVARVAHTTAFIAVDLTTGNVTFTGHLKQLRRHNQSNNRLLETILYRWICSIEYA